MFIKMRVEFGTHPRHTGRHWVSSCFGAQCFVVILYFDSVLMTKVPVIFKDRIMLKIRFQYFKDDSILQLLRGFYKNNAIEDHIYLSKIEKKSYFRLN